MRILTGLFVLGLFGSIGCDKAGSLASNASKQMDQASKVVDDGNKLHAITEQSTKLLETLKLDVVQTKIKELLDKAGKATGTEKAQLEGQAKDASDYLQKIKDLFKNPAQLLAEGAFDKAKDQAMKYYQEIKSKLGMK